LYEAQVQRAAQGEQIVLNSTASRHLLKNAFDPQIVLDAGDHVENRDIFLSDPRCIVSLPRENERFLAKNHENCPSEAAFMTNYLPPVNMVPGSECGAPNVG